jgi:hypothetical protein
MTIAVMVLAALVSWAGVDNLRLLGHNETNRNHEMDAALVGNRMFIACGFNQGAEEYDISDPANPQRTWLANGPNCWRLRPYGDTTLYAFCRREGVVLYDIHASPPTRLGQYNPAGNREALEGGALVGDTIYCAAHQNGVYAVDVSNPAAPTKVAALSLAPNSAAWNVEARDSFLFIANGRHGLAVAGLAGGLHLVARLDLPGMCNDIVLDGDVAVLSLGTAGIATVDLADPYNPVLRDTISTAGCAWGIGISNGLVACGSWRLLEVFDVGDPDNITRVGWDNTLTWAHGADIRADGVIGVADWRGVSVYDVDTDPGADIDINPEIVDFGQLSGPRDTTVAVYNNGLGTLNVTSVAAPTGFSVNPTSFSVAPGESLLVQVTASGGGGIRNTLTFNCNDPDEAARTIEVLKNNGGFPQVGSLAPDFNLLGTDAVYHRLSDYRGRVVYLDFGASW